MRNVIIQCLLTLSLVTGAVAAEKPLGVREYTSVDELATAISSYFPPVQGEVKTVAGDQLTIALGTKDGLQAGRCPYGLEGRQGDPSPADQDGDRSS